MFGLRPIESTYSVQGSNVVPFDFHVVLCLVLKVPKHEQP